MYRAWYAASIRSSREDAGTPLAYLLSSHRTISRASALPPVQNKDTQAL
jgi:hypothetical protein